MQQQFSALAQVDKDADPNRSLITTYDELLFRTKGMAVFWMLREMLGDAPLQAALKKYDATQDKEPSYFQKLLQAESKKDLESFFDDWVYRDRGLPDFKVESVYTRQILHGGYLATVTVENLGSTAAEVPIRVHFEHGDVRQRLIVKAHEKASARVEVATPPLEVMVNDGSVPESDTSNNTSDQHSDKTGLWGLLGLLGLGGLAGLRGRKDNTHAATGVGPANAPGRGV